MSDTPPFAEFMGRIRAGDARAAADLVRQWLKHRYPRLRRTLDSLDICQAVLASFFLRAAAGQYDLNDPSELVALLVRMAQNKLAGHARFHRRQRRDARQVTGMDGAGEAADAGPGPEQVAAGRDLLEALRGRLTPEERELADRRGAGQGWAEIAAALGGTVDGRRMQLKRAIDRVAPELGLEEDAEGDGDA